MRKGYLLSASALRSAAVAGGLVFAAPVFAQTPTGQPGSPPNQNPAGQASEVELESQTEASTGAQGGSPIVVTGSRIRRPNLESQVPIVALGGEEFFQQGQNNIGDTLNELPQLRATFGQQNAGRFLGTTGLNLLDLRGLGTNRTLVLVNGRRHVAADILSNAASPDVNTIPNDLIERVEVVTGGNSAIYGSDAIAGVVNFVLRRDFEGLQIRGNAGIAEEGFGGNQYVSALFGRNFADGRGNITLHAEYAHADRVYGSDIGFLRTNNAFLAVDSDTTGLPNGSDGFPDAVFFRDVRSASIYFNGLVPFPQTTANPRCGTGIAPSNGGPSTVGGTPYNCTFLFTPEGLLVPQTGTRTGTGRIGGIVGGNGQTGREGTLLSVLPFQERMNANLLARYEFTPAAELFLEAKYVRVNTQGQQSSPAFVQGITFGDARERPRLDNPFLSAQARAVITEQLLASGLNSALTTGTALSAAQRAAIADGSYRFTISRFLTDLGNRDEASQRDTFRVVGGLRGTFNDDWSYEASLNYGRVEEDTTILGNLLPQRFLLALDAARDPATGQIVCRSRFDPAARINYSGTPEGAAALAQDVASCVPYNPFGAPDNRAAAAYITQDTVSRATLEQFVATAFVSGDSSQLFELPGGPVRFAVGAEYRREEAFYQADPIVENGLTFYNALPTFDPEPFEVKEAFAEIQIPLLRDLPLIEELTLSGAGRIADYTNGPKGVLSYNAGVEYSPVNGVRFRANYGRAVRAPNYTETSTPLSQNFAPGFSDPCLPQNQAAGTQFRAANCRADLGALLDNPDFRTLPAYSLEFFSGSNPDLQEETSDSYTVGVVLTPRIVPGLSVTVDYFNITVNDVIGAVGAAQIVASCYDQPTLDNPFCALFQRNRGPGLGPNQEVPGQVLQRNLIASPINFQSLKRSGIDFEVAYRREIVEDITLNSRLIYTHQLQNSNFVNPADPTFENRILSELGDPQDEFRFDVDLTLDAFTFGYQLSYIGSQVTSTFEAFFPLQDRGAQNLDALDTIEYPSVAYHDIRFEWRVRGGDSFLGQREKDLSVYVGVDNLTDQNPPLDLTGIGGGSSIYSVRGRNFYAGFRARF